MPMPSLDEAGLAFTPVSGAFDVLIHSKDDNLTTTHTILVDLNGLDDDTSLNRPGRATGRDRRAVGQCIVDRGAAAVGRFDGRRVCVFRRYERRAGGVGDQHVFHRVDRPARWA